MHELEALSAADLDRLLEAGVTSVVVPFGSVEHQGAHLPLGADAILADAVGREAAARLGAVLAPTVRVGCAERHAALMGTLTVTEATLTAVAAEIAASLAAHGFRRVVLVSTHGGNGSALRAAAASLEGVDVRVPEGDVGPDPGPHSGAWLTSVMLALRPELVGLGAAPAGAAASAERGREDLERFVASVVRSARER